MARTQSRYQRGLSYEPGMATGRYTPGRAAADLGAVGGDYTGGVTQIPGAEGGGGGVAVPQVESTGNGLGGGTNLLAGLGLTALSNPRVTNWLTDQVRGTSGGIPTIQPDSGVQIAAGLPYNIGPRPTASLPIETGVPTAATDPYAPIGGVDWATGQPWPEGVAPDGGASVADGFSAMDGGLEGTGSWLSDLFSLYGDLSGSSLADAGLSLGGGALGNYIVHNTNMEGRRDPTGKNIGAAIGSIIGAPIPFFGPMLGAIIGGGIGGQFGPMASVGGNWGTLNSYTPGVGWSSHTGADNGGQANPAFSQAFQNALINYAQSQGYEANPLNTATYTVGQYTGNGPNAPFSGYYYQNAMGMQTPYGTDLSAPVGTWAQGPGGDPGWTGQNYGEAMVSNAFNDLNSQGFWTPLGTALTGDALQSALTQQRVDAYNGNEAAWAARNSQGASGN